MSEARLTLKEVAAELRMSERSVRELCRDGKIRYSRISRRYWLFTRKDIDEFLERNTFQVTKYVPYA